MSARGSDENVRGVERGADPNRVWARSIIDELVRGGVGHIAVSPGSRSTPLTLATAELAGMSSDTETGGGPTGPGLSVHYDERSAAFFSLGYARATGRPALCICTSGTAAANYLPAVVEAHFSHAPLILLTADRPPELRDTGAWQVIDQTKIYGAYTRWYAELGMPASTPEQLRYARSVAARAAATAAGRPAGPVHVNVPLRDPFPPWLARADAGAALDGDLQPGPISHEVTISTPAGLLDVLADRIKATPKGLILAGRLNRPPTRAYADAVAQLAELSGYPVLAEPTGGLRFGQHDRSRVITGYDAFLRDSTWSTMPESTPDLVIRLGASFTWRMVSDTLARFPQAHTVAIDPDGAWDDPARLVTERYQAEPLDVCSGLGDRLVNMPPDVERSAESSRWLERWTAAAERAAAHRQYAIDGTLDAALPPDVEVARTTAWIHPIIFETIGNRHGMVWAANSMAIRDLDTFTGPRPEPITVLAGRGAAGIDGTLSQAMGAASGWQAGGQPGTSAEQRGVRAHADRPAVLITGDLAFLHDLNGLAAEVRDDVQLAVVVVDDSGGGIFEYLPVSEGDRTDFERFFATPPRVDIETACAAFGVPCKTTTTAAGLAEALGLAIESGGLQVIVVPVDRASNTVWHRAYWDAVVRASGTDENTPAPTS